MTWLSILRVPPAGAGPRRPHPRLPPVASDMALLMGAHLTTRLLYLGLAGLIARVLGVEALGGWAVATVLGMLAIFLTDLGITPALIRGIAATRGSSAHRLAQALGTKLVLAAITLPLLGLATAVLPLSPGVHHLAWLMIMAGGVESFAQLNTGICRAHRRMKLEAWCALTQAVVTVGLSAVWVLAREPLVLLGYAAIAGAVAELLLSTVLRRRLVRGRRMAWSVWPSLRRGLPYAVTSLNAAAFFQVDILFLSLLAAELEVGEYAAVTRLLHGVGFALSLASGGALPAVTGAFLAQGAGPFAARGASVVRGLLLLAVGIAGITSLLARPVMTVVYGQEFAALAPLLRAGGVFLGLRLVAEAHGTLLTATGRQSVVAQSRLAGAAAGWVLLLVLTPVWGVAGAIAALVAGELLVTARLWWAVSRRRLTAPLARPAPGSFGTVKEQSEGDPSRRFGGADHV